MIKYVLCCNYYENIFGQNKRKKKKEVSGCESGIDLSPNLGLEPRTTGCLSAKCAIRLGETSRSFLGKRPALYRLS